MTTVSLANGPPEGSRSRSASFSTSLSTRLLRQTLRRRSRGGMTDPPRPGEAGPSNPVILAARPRRGPGQNCRANPSDLTRKPVDCGFFCPVTTTRTTCQPFAPNVVPHTGALSAAVAEYRSTVVFSAPSR